jgi:predicted RNase H-like HicB family nuclease
MSRDSTVNVLPEEGGFVANHFRLDIASEGDTVEEALANLNEAVELFYECASAEEIKRREAI